MHFSQLLPIALAAAGVVKAQLYSNHTMNSSKVLIKPCFYNNIVRYTRYSSATYTITLGGECTYVPYNASIIANININSSDTQAVVFRDDDREEFILAFPGTDSAPDYSTDFNFTQVPYIAPGVSCPGGCLAHGGFLLAWTSIASTVISTLNAAFEEYPCYELVITGHSLGGAIAALAYPSLKGLDYPVKYAYTYGQPRVGNQAVSLYIDALSGASPTKYGSFRRVTHSYDGVPNLPPISLNFTHPLTEFYELDIYTANGTIVPIAYDNDNITAVETQAANATYRCFGQDSLDCNTGSAKGFINQAHLHYSGVQMVGGGCAAPVV